ncbi:MAG TPA: HypC/HybG/HupF family hydrogenase formation chaperone [Candidatus Limnocylindria bacterium]|nr:HypC/HybG/HupF family hydrogenase formation chaperone [Candidatus Limnocylindria bacterium]
MCQGIPRLVLESASDRLRVDVDGAARWMKASERVAGAAPGEYVVVYAGVAIEKVTHEEAEEQLRFLRDLEAMFPADEDTA